MKDRLNLDTDFRDLFIPEPRPLLDPEKIVPNCLKPWHQSESDLRETVPFSTVSWGKIRDLRRIKPAINEMNFVRKNK